MKQPTKRSVGDIPGLELHLHPNLVKWIGLICVTLGSFSAAVLQQGILGLDSGSFVLEESMTCWANAAVLCTALSYLAIPIYARLVYEGVCRTSNFRAYLVRLIALALLAEVPYDRVTAGVWFSMGSQNPVWGLAIAAMMLELNRKYRQPGPRGSILPCLTLLMAAAWVLVLRSQYGIFTVILAAVYVLFPAKKGTAALAGGLICLLQFPAPLGMLAAYWYDGDRGKPKKYLFYLLYLAQLVFFALLAQLMG